MNFIKNINTYPYLFLYLFLGSLFSRGRYRWYCVNFLLLRIIIYKIKTCFLTEFRECFYLFARNGQIRTLDELTIIMRSLGLSPTIAELNKYLKDKGNK